MTTPIDEADQRELLRIARVTLSEYLEHHYMPPGRPHRPTLLVDAAVFVTLELHGRLRGCLGTTTADRPLFRAVQEMAVAAATRDPRFAPLAAAEVAQVSIDISVLGPRERVAGPDDLIVGQHGVAIVVRGQRALYLPQVAPEAGWDAARLVAELCRKARLPPDAWTEADAVLERFTAQVFGERG